MRLRLTREPQCLKPVLHKFTKPTNSHITTGAQQTIWAHKLLSYAGMLSQVVSASRSMNSTQL